MKLKQRLLSFMLVFAMLITYMPITNTLIPEVYAAEGDQSLYIDKGNIKITRDGYEQGVNPKVEYRGNYVIKGESLYKNTIVIDGYTGTITLEGVSIKSQEKAPITVKNNSTVTFIISGNCSIANTSNDSSVTNYPGIDVSGDETTVTFSGGVENYLEVGGGKFCPSIGGCASDDSSLGSARRSVFNSTIIFDGPTIKALGTGGAPCIGTGRACNVEKGKIIFKSGKIEAVGTTSNSLGIGVCSTSTLTDSSNVGKYVSNLTLDFQGGGITASGSTNAPAIGAGIGQDAYIINISSGCSITASGGPNAPAIGAMDDNHINAVNISGGALDLTAGSNCATVIGDGPTAEEATAKINISGGKLIAKGTANKGYTFKGKVSISNDKKLYVTVSRTAKDAAKASVRIPYVEYSKADYFNKGLVAEDGTYFKSLKYSSYIDKCQYVEIGACESHEFTFKECDDPITKHSRLCIYCNTSLDPVGHSWKYTVTTDAAIKRIDGVCSECGAKRELTFKDVTEYYSGSTHAIYHITNTVEDPYTVKYRLKSQSIEQAKTDPPRDAGEYIATVTVDTVSIDVNLKIERSKLEFTVTQAGSYQYDPNARRCSTVHVTKPAEGATVKYKTETGDWTTETIYFTDAGNHAVFYEITCPGYNAITGVMFVNIIPKTINSLTVTGITKPSGGKSFDTQAECGSTDGNFSTPTPTISWFDADGKGVDGTTAKYNTEYYAKLVVKPDPKNSAISSGCSVITSYMEYDYSSLKADGSLTIYTKKFRTPKSKLQQIINPADVSFTNGVSIDDIVASLPTEVETCTDGDVVTSMTVEWDKGSSTPTYVPAAEEEQNFTLTGNVTVPEEIDKDGVATTCTVRVKVNKAKVAAVTADIEQGTYADNQHVKLSTATSGAKIYYTTDGTVPTKESTLYDPESEGILIAGEEARPVKHTIKAIALKDNLEDSDVSEFVYTISKADDTPPTVEIQIEGNKWKAFWSTVTFGLFTTSTYDVTITYADVGTGIADNGKLYYVSDKELSEVQLDNITTWETYTGKFSIEPRGKFIVYAKAIDNAALSTYANSEGLVLYNNSTPDDTELTVISSVVSHRTFKVNLNGNTVSSVDIDGVPLSKDRYDATTSPGAITLNANVFTDLTVGDHVITVKYAPRGETFSDKYESNVAPTPTACNLKVILPRLLSVTSPTAITDVPNGTALDEIELPDTVTVTTDDSKIKELGVIWDRSHFVDGTYDPSSMESSDFILEGTLQIDSNKLDQNNIPDKVTIRVNVNPAATLQKPVASMNPGSYTKAVTVTLTSPDGADIYYTTDGSTPSTETAKYTEPLVFSETTSLKAICIKDGLFPSSVMSVVYTITTKDESKPTGSITIGKESFWSSLWSGTLYQFFTKNTQVVTITGADEESGISAIFYYISPVELDASGLGEVTGWELYTEPLHLDPNVGGIIYAKIINGDGGESFVNSNGIVVFTDPEKVTESVTYVKGTGNDVEFTVKLNGNSIKAMRNGSTTLSPAHYSQTFSGNIVLSAAYLDTLSTGNYTFYVDYYPLGINNSNAAGNSEAPASTSLSVLVSAKSTGANTGTGSNTGGGSSSGTPNVPIVIPQDPNFEGNATGTTTRTDASGVVHKIDTVTYTDKSKTITDTSTSKDKTKTVVVTEKDPKGATTTVATKTTTKDGTETYTVTEYVSANETKTTTNKSDTKGNTYERVYVTNKNGASSESIVSTVNDVKTTDVYKVDVSGNLSQTYSTTQELNGEIIDVTVDGSGTQTSPKYTESYTLVEDGLDKCNVTVTRTNSDATATASVVKTNEAGNKVVISSALLDNMLTAASWNDVNGSLPNVSTVHTFSKERKAVSDIDVTYKVMNDSGNKRYTLMFNTDDIFAGNKLRQFRYTGGKYVMLGAKYKTVSDSGNLSITPDKNYTYLLAGPEKYKNINNSIKASAVFADTSTAQVPKGKSTYFRLDDEFDSRNVKSITYKSKNGLVASVNNSGKVTAKRSGTAKITATIKFVNGGSKTITRSIKVK